MTVTNVRLSGEDLARLNEIVSRATRELQEVVKDKSVLLAIEFPQNLHLKITKQGVYTSMSMERLLEVVCEVFRVSEESVKSGSRYGSIMLARHAFRHMAYTVFSLGSHKEVAEIVGSLNHSTTIYSCEQAEDLLLRNATFLNGYRKVFEQIYYEAYGVQPNWKEFYSGVQR